MFAKAIQTVPAPDLAHTWAQAPIKFEDALGRIMPVPSEYDWDVSSIALIRTRISLTKLGMNRSSRQSSRFNSKTALGKRKFSPANMNCSWEQIVSHQ